MKKVLAFLVTTVIIANVYAQEPAAYASAVTKFKLFYNTNKPDSIYNMFGPEMRAALTTDQLVQVKAQLGNLNNTSFINYTAPVASYNAEFQNGPLVMRLSLNSKNQIIGLLMQPAEAKPATSTIASDPAVTESPVLRKTLAGNISGTLTLPKNAGAKMPVVLIIAGSGPTDRDGNNPAGDNSYSYKLMANALGNAGIACLRYDKRNIGKSVSSVKEKESRFDDNSDDAISLIDMLHNDPRFSKIIVMGHSEGSLVGMIASADQPVNAFISLAGAGSRADLLITEQLKSQPDYIANGFKTILDSLKKGKFTDRVDPSLYALARPSIQPYLLSWFRYDPAREIKKLKIPILIIQGTTDLQVSVAEAEKLKKAKSDAVLTIIPNMNHVLKDAPVDKDANLATYKDPNLPLKPELVTAVTGFINKLK